MHRSLLCGGDCVLFVDGWAASGGQALAYQSLVDQAGAHWIGAAVIVDGLESAAARHEFTRRSLLRLRELGQAFIGSPRPRLLGATAVPRLPVAPGVACSPREGRRRDNMPEALRAFVLMPFDEDFEAVYSELIKGPLEAHGFEVSRADSLLNQRSVLADVISGIASADLIVADASGLNPNVLYEMGLAHALGKPTVMVTQNIEELPFDLRPYRANEYSTRFNEADELANTLGEIGGAMARGEAEFSNPVQDFAPEAFVRVQGQRTSSRRRADTAEEGKGEDGSESEPGLIEAAVALQEGNAATEEVAERIAAATSEVGERFSVHSERLVKAQKNLGDRGAGVFLSIMRDAARDLDEYRDGMMTHNQDLRGAIDRVAIAANVIAQHRIIDGDADRQSVTEDIVALEQAEQKMAETRQSVLGFADSIISMPPMDSILTRAERRAAQIVNETAEIIESGEAEMGRARKLLADRLASHGS